MQHHHVVIIQGHPDPAGGHLCHGLADAYAEGAAGAGNVVSRVDLANLDFPVLRSQAEFESGTLPSNLNAARDAIVSADHIVLVFPLWLGTMPALVKAFLEQVMRPGVGFAYQSKGLPKKLLKGRSARIVVTMGMPAIAYRWFFRAHALHALNRNVLGFVGIAPIRTSLFGMVENASEERRRNWLGKMRALGNRAA
jgi:putative NADPH-quinone reductase